jgi:hypothetical protein
MDEIDALESLDEVQLWCAVVRQAWSDALSVGDTKSGCMAEERAEARRWLTSPLSPWREDREMVCQLAGLSADKLVARARAVLNPVLAREAEAAAQRVETPEDRAEREKYALHIELCGEANPRNKLRGMSWLRREMKNAARRSSGDLIDLVTRHERLFSIAEIDEALEEAARLEEQESRDEECMAPSLRTRRATRVDRYIETDILVITAK